MKILVNAGFGNPIGPDLLAQLKSFGFHGCRQDILRPEDAKALVHEQLAAGMDGIYIVRDALSARMTTIALQNAYLPGIIELGNEEDSKQTPKQYHRQFVEHYRAVREVSAQVPVFTAGITTTDRKRLDWLRDVYAQGIPADCGTAIHTYRQETPPGWAKPGFGSRAAEYEAVREIIGPSRRLILSEIGWHLAPFTVKKGWFGSEQKTYTETQVADYLLEECRIASENGVESLTVFQITDGPDPNNYEHRFGLRRMDGTWRPTLTACMEGMKL